MSMKIISFAAARQLRYVRLCYEEGYSGPVKPWVEEHSLSNSWYSDPAAIEGYPSETNRFALVEHSRYGQTWITLHDSAEAAGSASVNQEYAEDWMDAYCVDLACGVQYQFELRAVPIPIRKPEGART